MNYWNYTWNGCWAVKKRRSLEWGALLSADDFFFMLLMLSDVALGEFRRFKITTHLQRALHTYRASIWHIFRRSTYSNRRGGESKMIKGKTNCLLAFKSNCMQISASSSLRAECTFESFYRFHLIFVNDFISNSIGIFQHFKCDRRFLSVIFSALPSSRSFYFSPIYCRFNAC